MRSPTSPFLVRAGSNHRQAPVVDAYLMPAVVGGGVGDIDEVLCAGRILANAGIPPILYHPAGMPLPPGVGGPWAWPPHLRTGLLRPRSRFAMTIAPAWGITCAPGRGERLGRPGPWAQAAAEVERTYGVGRTVHVSLEEFARTLTSRAETLERFREGGTRSRDLRSRLARAEVHGEVAAYHQAYRKFRALDRPNVLHLYATFRYDHQFAREFPEAIQVGPLGAARSREGRHAGGLGDWVWYASPASAETIAPAVVEGLGATGSPPPLLVRTPRPWRPVVHRGALVVRTDPLPARLWRRRFRDAALRIVTGSRSLLEALEVGGPFLYFNGVLGSGRARRRHRPEKIVAFLEVARSDGWPADLLHDLGDFSRGRRVAEVVARAVRREASWRRFPPPPRPRGLAPGFGSAGEVIVQLARALGSGGGSATDLVASVRARSHR